MFQPGGCALLGSLNNKNVMHVLCTVVLKELELKKNIL